MFKIAVGGYVTYSYSFAMQCKNSPFLAFLVFLAFWNGHGAAKYQISCVTAIIFGFSMQKSRQ
jgi:hypothetical protein